MVVCRRSTLVIIGLALALTFSPVASAAEGPFQGQDTGPSADAILADVVVFRPLGLLSVVLGTGLFVISAPFSAVTGNVDQVCDTLMMRPARMTFIRPLGAEP